MKKSLILVFIAFLLIASQISAQNQPAFGNGLPQLLEAVPDPAQILGSLGSLYQQNVEYHGGVYNSYIFPRPASADLFLPDYTRAAVDAGYTAESDTLDGYSALRIYDAGNRDTTALLFPDYQGYLLLLVPPAMSFTLHDEIPEQQEPSRLVEMGSAAIANGDYQTAVRYLIKAAGLMMRTEETPAATATPAIPAPLLPPTSTPSIPLQQGEQIYTVQAGDSCWSIAAQFGLGFQEFMDANGFTDCNLFIGDEVKIPGQTVRTPTPTPLPGAQHIYTVEEGDNCWSIAVNKFGVNFELFMAINNMTECSIRVGDEVIIPGTDQQMPTATPISLDQYAYGEQIRYVVGMNDSYNDIAAKFNTTLISIQQLNNVNVYTGFPQYGQVLTIAVNLVTPTPLPEVTETPQPGTLAP